MRFGRLIVLVLLPAGLSACGKTEPARPLAAVPAAPNLEPSVPLAPRFVNAAPEAGLTALLYCGGVSKDHLLESTGTGVALIDYDGDGRLDAFLVNAWALDEEPSRVRIKGRNILYHNKGGGRFEDVTVRAGVGGDGWGGGVCAGDYDNDGRIDLFVTGFGACRLYRNQGDGTFEQVAERRRRQPGVVGRRSILRRRRRPRPGPLRRPLYRRHF